MTVYIDCARPYALAVADTPEELEAMRTAGGGWMFQPLDQSRPIRCVAPAYVARMVQAGAVRVAGFQSGFMFAQWEATGRLGKPGAAEEWFVARKVARELIARGEELLA